MKIKPFNIIDHIELPEVMVDGIPVAGDPLEINNEMYYVCETNYLETDGLKKIGVIPLIIKNPGSVKNTGIYLKYLAIAIRRMQVVNGGMMHF